MTDLFELSRDSRWKSWPAHLTMKTLATISVIWLAAAVEICITLFCQYAAVYGSDWVLAANQDGCNGILFVQWLVLTVANVATAWLVISDINS